VAELAIHVVLAWLAAGVLIVGECDGLSGLDRTLGPFSAPTTPTLDEGDASQRENASQPADEPMLSHAKPCS
jgi:hypothetical protein